MAHSTFRQTRLQDSSGTGLTFYYFEFLNSESFPASFMICGSFSLSASDNSRTDWTDFRDNSSGLSFQQVSREGFDGGYYLHPRLPLTGDDFFYHEEGEDLFVLFSGYIYNKKELAPLFGFTENEPEPRIAARLFRDEGPEFVRRLNGDFVIFICQPARRCAYLFRDQVGIRPVAYSTDSGRLMFSSDITDLCRRMSGKTAPAREYLLGYFKYVD